ncbi:MAG: hypothetical protein ISS72_04980 [Candidatus Brocadiae bacterium]|nr:hypothetical protein [Candidatus Brocadiia bacterium]
MPDDETNGLYLADPERELLAMVLMGDFALRARVEDTPPGEEVDLTSAELALLDDILAIELEHTKDRSHRRALEQVRERVARILSL